MCRKYIPPLPKSYICHFGAKFLLVDSCYAKALVEGKNFTPRTAFEKVVHDPNIEDSPAADKAADVVGDEEL